MDQGTSQNASLFEIDSTEIHSMTTPLKINGLREPPLTLKLFSRPLKPLVITFHASNFVTVKNSPLSLTKANSLSQLGLSVIFPC